MGQLAETAGVQIGYLGVLAPQPVLICYTRPFRLHKPHSLSYRFKNHCN